MHDDFPRAFSQTFRVRYDECGPGGWMRASAHLRACQETAFAHSEAVGFPLAWYEQNRFFWICGASVSSFITPRATVTRSLIRRE